MGTSERPLRRIGGASREEGEHSATGCSACESYLSILARAIWTGALDDGHAETQRYWKAVGDQGVRESGQVQDLGGPVRVRLAKCTRRTLESTATGVDHDELHASSSATV